MLMKQNLYDCVQFSSTCIKPLSPRTRPRRPDLVLLREGSERLCGSGKALPSVIAETLGNHDRDVLLIRHLLKASFMPGTLPGTEKGMTGRFKCPALTPSRRTEQAACDLRENRVRTWSGQAAAQRRRREEQSCLLLQGRAWPVG